MALTKGQKNDVIAKVDGLLAESKMTVVARYSGLSVKNMQELRAKGKENGVAVTVAKNRLVKVALQKHDALKDIDVEMFKGQLAYIFGTEDEVVATQTAANFAKEHESLEIVGGFNAQGEIFTADQITQLSKLPSKDAMRAQLVGTIAAPISGFVTVMSGNLRGFVNVLNARREAIS